MNAQHCTVWRAVWRARKQKKQGFPLPRPSLGDSSSSNIQSTGGPAEPTKGKTVEDKAKWKLAEKVRDLQKQGAEVFKSIKTNKTTQDKLQRILDGLTELKTMATRQEQAYQKEHIKIRERTIITMTWQPS